MPSMTMSPCARLMIRMTPNTMVSPTAIIAYSEPVRMPLTTLWAKISILDSRKIPARFAGGDQAMPSAHQRLVGEDIGRFGVSLGPYIEQLAFGVPLRKHGMIARGGV